MSDAREFFAVSRETATQLPKLLAHHAELLPFAAASRHVSVEAVAEQVSCGPSVDSHLQTIDRYVQAGYDHLILLQIGPEQEAFLQFFERELAPRFRRSEAA